MTIKSASTLVAEALKEIKTISPSEALEKVNNNTCNLIDIRDVRELERLGRIENSSHIPRGMLEFWMDPDSQYFKEGKIDMNKEIVLFCAGGLRSALATKTLQNMGYKNITNVRQGKYFEIEIEETNKDKANATITEICEKLLTNVVIENYKTHN